MKKEQILSHACEVSAVRVQRLADFRGYIYMHVLNDILAQAPIVELLLLSYLPCLWRIVEVCRESPDYKAGPLYG